MDRPVRDSIILVDGMMRGSALTFGVISLIALFAGPYVIAGLSALFGAILSISLSWAIGWVYKDLNLPS